MLIPITLIIYSTECETFLFDEINLTDSIKNSKLRFKEAHMKKH